MRLLTIAAAGAVVLTSHPLAAAQPDPLRDPRVYGALPSVSEAAISPDGRTIAQIQAVDGGGRAVVFIDIDGRTAPVGMGLENAKARRLQWAGDNHVMLLVSTSIAESFGDGLKNYEIWRWFIIDREAKTKSIPFRSWRRGVIYFGSGSIECFGAANSDTVVMAHQNPYSLFSVSLDDGAEKLIQRGEAATRDWVLDADCKPALRIDYDSNSEEIRLYGAKADGGFDFKSSIKSRLGDDDAVSDLALIGEPGEFAGIAADGDALALRRLDIDTGVLRPGGIGVAGFDVAGAIFDPYTNRAVGIRYFDDMARARFLVEPLKSLQGKAANVFKGASAVVSSWSRDYSRLVVDVAYPDHPDQAFLYEPAKKSVVVIGSTYPKLDGRALPRREKYDYISSDGLKVPGYLTRPATAGGAGPAPLIVLPHGGPASRDQMGFDWWAGFYAANGYLVYQPNFRGSFGYGAAYRLAGDGQWGRKMQDDISEGVRRLAADGVADPARVCIVGASYGGYAALAGATLTPALYACAVSVNGVSNLPAIIASESESTEKYWTKRIGSIFKDKDAITAVSPVKQVSKATPPVMLIQSSDDIVVPPGQSVLMRKALEDANRPVTYVTLEGEDHWLSNEKTRIEMLSRSLDFIDDHIGSK